MARLPKVTAGRLVSLVLLASLSPAGAAMSPCLGAGAEVSTKGVGGLTPLHSAARLSGPAVVEVLLAAGADPEGPQDLTIAVVLAAAVSPLHPASQAGKTALVEVLLAAGAAVNSQEAEGFTALQYAAEHHHLMARDRARSAVAVVSGTAQPRFLRSTCPVLSCHSSWP